MNYYFCDACHYCFEYSALPDRCPDCGQVIHRSSPAVRPATDKEISDLLRVRAEDETEQKLTACG